jgi:hypothetical protein
MVDQTANFVRGEADSSIGAGDTTISVVNASEFPDPANGQYNLVLWDDSLGRPDQDSDAEIVRVTGRDTTNDNLTVTRAQEGTSDVSHPSGSALQLSPTAKTISDIDAEITDTFTDLSNVTKIKSGQANLSSGLSANVVTGYQAANNSNIITGFVSPSSAASTDVQGVYGLTDESQQGFPSGDIGYEIQTAPTVTNGYSASVFNFSSITVDVNYVFYEVEK